MKNYLNRTSLFLTLLTGLLYIQASHSKEQVYYDIEIVLFKYNKPENFSAEQWSSDWTLPDIDKSMEVVRRSSSKNAVSISPILNSQYLDGEKNALPRKSGYTRLSSANHKLKNEANKIAKSSRFTILKHTAWRQPGLGPKKVLPIRIRAGQAYNLQNTNPNLPRTTYEVDGSIKVVLGRYLHVYTDLLYTQAVNQVVKSRSSVDSADGAPEKVIYETILSSSEQAGSMLYGFNFKQHRRMRSKKLHHIDNPLLGMLIYAERVEKKKP